MKMSRIVALVLVLVAVLSCFASCFGGEKEKITIWVSEVKGVKELTKAQVEDFIAANPGYGYTIDDIVIQGVPEADAGSQVLLDVVTAPDLYCFAQDQLARLVKAKALAALGSSAAAAITANNDAGSVAAVTAGDKLYAYPMTSDNGYYLYYDKSIVTDPTDLQAIVDACVEAGAKFHFEIQNGWYAASFFFGVGCESIWETDADGNFTGIKDTFDDETLGTIAMKGIQIVTTSDCYVNKSNFEGDNIGAIVTGTWNAEEAEEYFEDNLGVCQLPTFTVEGQTYQLGSFSGYKVMGVKPQEDLGRLEFCTALAQYLTGEQCQKERFDTFQWGPSNKNLQATADVQNNPSLKALKAQNEFSVSQGYIPNEWWTSAATLAGKAKNCFSNEEILAALAAYRKEINDVIAKANK